MFGFDKSDPNTHVSFSLKEVFMKGLSVFSSYPLPVPENVRPHQELAEFIDSLETLDLILYSCPISWYSMQLQGGRWTHVGMIYKRDGKTLTRHDKLDGQDPAKILILESIIGKEEERTSGVDLVDAKKRFD